MWVSLLLALVAGAYIWRRWSCHSDRLPPGPFNMPVLGSWDFIRLYLTGGSLVEMYQRLGKRYGPVVFLRIPLDTPVVCIRGYEAIKAASKNTLLAGMNSTFFYRMNNAFKNHGLSFADGKTWRHNKTFAMRELADKKRLEALANAECSLALDTLLAGSERTVNIEKALVLATTNVLLRLAFSRRMDLPEDQYAAMREHIVALFSIIAKFQSWLDIFPWLRALDSNYRNERECLRVFAEYSDDIIQEHVATLDRDNPRDLVDAYLISAASTSRPGADSSGSNSPGADSSGAISSGANFPGVVSSGANASGANTSGANTSGADSSGADSTGADASGADSSGANTSLDNLRVLIKDLLVGGVDGPAITLTWVLMLVAAHPRVQTKLQHELDAVLGSERAPTLDDQRACPYTCAVIEETHRFFTLTPFNRHGTTQGSTNLLGYHIPGGSVILVDLHSLQHSQETWGDPETFRPERFLAAEGPSLSEHVRPFGFSPRRCPAEAYSRGLLFLFVVQVFQRMTLRLPERGRVGVREIYSIRSDVQDPTVVIQPR